MTKAIKRKKIAGESGHNTRQRKITRLALPGDPPTTKKGSSSSKEKHHNTVQKFQETKPNGAGSGSFVECSRYLGSVTNRLPRKAHSKKDSPPENRTRSVATGHGCGMFGMNGTSELRQNGLDEKPPAETSEKHEIGNHQPDMFTILEDQKNKNFHKQKENVIEQKIISRSHLQISMEALLKMLLAIFASLPRRFELQKFKLRNCNVSGDFLNRISKQIQFTKAKILDLSGNKGLDMEAVRNLRIKLKSEVLDLSDMELDENQILVLGKMKIKILRLNYSSFAEDSISGALAILINNGLEELSLVDSNISDNQLVALANGLKGNLPLRVLDLTHVSLGHDGVLAIAQIVNKTNKTKGMEKLALSDCDLTTEILTSFRNDAKNKIAALDVSSNQQILECDIKWLATLAEKVKSEEFDISSNGVTGSHIEQLLTMKRPEKLQKLCLSENPGIEPTAIGKLAKKWELRSLDLSECRLNASEITKLGQSIGSHKLNWLDVSDPSGVLSNEKRGGLEVLSRKAEKLLYGNHEIWV